MAPRKKTPHTSSATQAEQSEHLPFDPVNFNQKLMSMVERAQPALHEAIKNYSENMSQHNLDPLNISKAYTGFLEQIAENPQKYVDAQTTLWQDWFQLWQDSARKFMGEDIQDTIEPERGDRRFKAPEWHQSALFDFIKQSYLLTTKWMHDTVQDTEGLERSEKDKLAFYTKLYADALSPSNFLFTNPEVINETFKSGGENLLRGFENLIEDLERGHGALKISTTDYEAFKFGENIATTPGRVVYRNDLVQLIQYEPTTTKVHKRPLLIVPPWINKYYILDLRPDNSLIKFALDEGHTVFVISWVNPTKKLSEKTFEDYMNEGILASLDEIKSITKHPDCNVVGYCLGGTLLAVTMAYLLETKQTDRVATATFLTTLIDFEHSGDLKLFMDGEQIQAMDKMMGEFGILRAEQLKKTFSLLRANDMIWSFVVNNYLMGKEPFPFDLLYWNDDSTNMPAAMHSFYLRNMYRDNKLIEAGGIEMNGVAIDIRKIKTPSYFLSTKEDHIAPWKATYDGARLFSGPTTFTLAASGHIAGVINSPAKNKYCYWSAGKVPAKPDTWYKDAKQSEGSWWPHWAKWLKNQNTQDMVPARKPAKGIEPAPGSYVKVKGS